VTRYSKQHKDLRRNDILDAASRAFRTRGVDAVSVAELMADSGLTHGGFYAHFTSKDQLVGEACAHALRGSTKRIFPQVLHLSPLQAFVRRYLSRSHRDEAFDGCVIPALAADIARRSPETRHAFTEAARDYVSEIVCLSAGELEEDQGWALVSGMAGAVMLARAVDDPWLSDRILASARELYGASSRASSIPTVPDRV
jgi:TetR/AcrR family transcriptional repressor of nem operon